MEFKPYNPPILWKEAGVKYPPKRDWGWRGGGGVGDFVNLWKGVSGIYMGLFLEIRYPIGSIFITILVSVWVQIFCLVGTPLPMHFQRKTPPPLGHKAWCSAEEVPYCFSRSSVNFKVSRHKKWSVLTRIERFWTVTPVFTRGQFWPSGIVITCVCVCVRVFVCVCVSITCLSAR